MRLKVLLPTKVLIDEPVAKVIAEAENGSFCLEERHIDFVAALVPGLLSFRTPHNEEVFVAVDEGTLVKCGAEGHKWGSFPARRALSRGASGRYISLLPAQTAVLAQATYRI